MAPSIRNGNKNHNLWLKHPDGHVNQIGPGDLIVPNDMVSGNYELASIEIVPGPILGQRPGVFVTNVGLEIMVFVSPKYPEDNNLHIPDA